MLICYYKQIDKRVGYDTLSMAHALSACLCCRKFKWTSDTDPVDCCAWVGGWVNGCTDAFAHNYPFSKL